MPSFRQGEIVQVPFPYTDRTTRQRRPAIVISTGNLQERHGLLWVVMITSAENRGWANDIAIPDYEATGLPSPSVIRAAKLATIEARDATGLGEAPAQVVEELLAVVSRQILGIVP